MADSGEAKMSAYGKTVYNPYEQSAQWVEKIKREEKLKKQHKVTNGEGAVIDTYFKGVKPSAGPDITKDISYYNNYKEHNTKGMYERTFTVEHDYNPKLHRDDRQHNVGMDLHGETVAQDDGKKNFMRSNSVYGKRPPIDPMGVAQEHAIVQVITQEFFDHGPKDIGKTSFSRSSSVYGKRAPIDPALKLHVKVQVTREFYRTNANNG